jgi:hypothetical protein
MHFTAPRPVLIVSQLKAERKGLARLWTGNSLRGLYESCHNTRQKSEMPEVFIGDGLIFMPYQLFAVRSRGLGLPRTRVLGVGGSAAEKALAHNARKKGESVITHIEAQNRFSAELEFENR